MSQSLGRALDILDLVSRGVRTLDALAAEVGVHKSTVLRLLQTLEERGFVGRDSAHRYHVGPAVFALASTALDAQDVRAAAAPALRALAAETGQTVHLATYQDGIVSYVDKVESRQPLRMYSRIGLPAPLNATAVGKVLLGGLDLPERERVVAAISFERFTDRTLTTPEALLEEVHRGAERGWAEDHEEHETFMNCVGAPVYGPDGRVAAAVSVSVPNVVLPYEGVLGLVPALLAATARISAELGAPAGPAAATSDTTATSATMTTATTERTTA
ncbi:IclR family transcriptional regulator [Leifsonia sp. NPDC080035]|uniref:IclR family transcriptional regulator n=1 Tax=Leifsonia sp. NPDC080035 TaxID=3143936 RepID=A0AAU7GFU7_9MICO